MIKNRKRSKRDKTQLDWQRKMKKEDKMRRRVTKEKNFQKKRNDLKCG